MDKSSADRGYTVIEVLVFIAVSGLILLGSLIMFNGRQGQIQYEQGVSNVNSKIQETIHNVSNGHFTQPDYICENGSDDWLRLTINSAPDPVEQGTSDDCVFAGMAIEQTGDPDRYEITTILAAKPEKVSTPMSLRSSNAKLTAFVDASQVVTTSWGLQITGIYDQGGNPIDTILFLSELGRPQTGSASSLASGTQSVGLYTSSSLGSNQRVVLDDPSRPLPISICLEDNNNERQAAIRLGVDGRELTTSVDQDLTDEDSPCL